MQMPLESRRSDKVELQLQAMAIHSKCVLETQTGPFIREKRALTWGALCPGPTEVNILKTNPYKSYKSLTLNFVHQDIYRREKYGCQTRTDSFRGNGSKGIRRRGGLQTLLFMCETVWLRSHRRKTLTVVFHMPHFASKTLSTWENL